MEDICTLLHMVDGDHRDHDNHTCAILMLGMGDGKLGLKALNPYKI